MTHVTLYSDGACSGNPGPGGWGAVLISGSHMKELGGHVVDATNNRMALTAVIEGLKALKFACDTLVVSDSQYVQKVIAAHKGGGKIRANIDLVRELYKLLNQHTVDVRWVKGHAGHKFNERCDEIAAANAREAWFEAQGFETDVLD